MLLTFLSRVMVAIRMSQLLDYYSGSQAKVFFDNVWIDDVKAISWEARQEKRPLWGYASQQFDDVAKGVLIINGQFNINFRGRGYITAVIDFIRNKDSKNSSNIESYLDRIKSNNWTNQDIVNLINNDEFDKYLEAYEKVVWDSESLNNTEFNRPDEYSDGLNIVIKYGNWEDDNESNISSTKVLSGVHLLGQSQIVRVGGEAVAETYSFIARGIDDDKTK